MLLAQSIVLANWFICMPACTSMCRSHWQDWSIRTERMHLRHQYILFYLKFGMECNNPADYWSQYITQWKSVSKSAREESNDLSKLLYILHITSVLDALEIRKIAGHSKMDGTLAKLEDLILGSKTYIHSWNPHPSTIKWGGGGGG